MAGAARRRVNSVDTRPEKRYYRLETYEDGSAVREVAVPLEEEEEEQYIRPQRKARPQVSTQTRRNRARAQSLSVGYVLFLTAVCIAAVFLCINFLQLKAKLTMQSQRIASMETNLSKLQADNDAYYRHALTTVTLDEVRATAIDKLGMHNASETQIRYYSPDDTGSYVRQYQEVPD